MIDTFALALSHGLLLLAAWRLATAPGLDEVGPARDEEKPPRA